MKPSVDEAKALAAINGDLTEYAKARGCIERKTWKLLEIVQTVRYVDDEG